MRELTLLDTNGILRQPWVRPDRTSVGLGWADLYVSTQREQPYGASFDGAASHLVILHRSGPVTVRRGHRGLAEGRTVPAGGFFVHPAGKELTVELGGPLDTVHVYLTQAMLRQADDGPEVELVEELGVLDPLMEQLVVALDRALTHWQPAGRTYIDQVGAMLAAQLAHRHSAGRPALAAVPVRSGLSDRQLARVHDLLAERLGEPVPLADMAAEAGLSVSQFARQFKARVGVAPHQYLVGLRIDAARRLLERTRIPIAQVAVECGFSHQEHLTRVLRARLGVTPAALRGLTR